MREPEIWKKFGEQFHQDAIDIEEIVTVFSSTLSAKDKSDLHSYLLFLEHDAILGTEKKAWFESGAQIFPRIRGGKKWSNFYKMLRKLLEDN
jgi:hypothetical protein